MTRIEGLMDVDALLPFVRFQTSRSGGAGGQHVNKVETRVTLLFDIAAATVFSDDEKARIRKRLAGRLQADGRLQLSSQETRSQFRILIITFGVRMRAARYQQMAFTFKSF